MENSIILLWLAVSILIILVLILKFKLNAAIAMFIGALFMGIASNVGMTATVGAISTGFGNTLKGIGISVGFGVMLGQLVADVGAVQTIANGLLKVFGEKRADYAMGSTGFIVSIPVFYDVGYVILTPLAKTLARKNSQKILPHFVGGLVAGLGIAHTFIPPTPCPMTGGELMGVPIGVTIAAGIAIGLPTFLLSMFIYNNVFLKRKGFWTESCEEHDPALEAEANARAEELMRDESKLPGMFASLLPIALPIVLILINTVWGAIVGKNADGASLVPDFVQMLGAKEFAMMAGTVAAMAVCLMNHRMTAEQVEKSISKAVGAAGTVLLITGMGGGLGQVLTAAGVGSVLEAILHSVNMPIILFVWLIAALLKVAQGSGTVAMITALGIVSSMGTLGANPVLIAMAGFSGTLCGAHVNDSAFWITAKISGLSTEGGFKTYTLVCFLESVISLALILVASLFIH